MSAKTIIPATTLFQKFLIISGLKKVTPARSLEPREQAMLISQIQAEAVRGVAKELGIECSPRLLKEPESCPTCRKSVRMLVEPPYNVCFDCFGDISLDSN
jgi:hypothetical protein